MGGGGSIAYSSVSSVIATDCHIYFLDVRGSIDKVIIKNFKGNEVAVWGGTYKEVLLENINAESDTDLFEAEIDYIYIKNLKTRSLGAFKSKFNEIFMDQVAFGAGSVHFEKTKIDYLRTRNVTFKNPKRVKLKDSDADFKHSEVEWKIYEMERKNPIFPELLPENRFKGYFTWEG